ncbi:protein-L-isoaspartate(D-aspartate) O-methyltransferase [Lichenihabitans sp. PAMC28606]|uniref:protein-L-isoaspartate O-methyltransferase family protein n=1 Tax=Lichenihabitans sp. PAMC28606 TaxID=2880932 RepID=UPI001D0B526C|nr:rRNA adenine N-6-methyltransferase family protein [Lichenihabitans sp. PAMC28606]UDL95384.1 protein-L-isoaspartate(D-aspartate) O-methyltransferase [Lichenihabitans sp. PAMC28606]
MTWSLPPGIVDRDDPERRSAEATASFLLRLRASGIRDLALLRAMEAVPRAIFVPHRYADLAGRDIALPIGCGQTMPEPSFVASVLEALSCTPQCRVLEVGAGTGYTTAILSRLVRDVVAMERFQDLAIEACARLDRLGITNATIDWEDGLDPHQKLGSFDRIVVHAGLDEAPLSLLGRLAPGGTLIYAENLASTQERRRSQTLMRITLDRDGGPLETAIRPSRLQGACKGRSAVL